MEVEQPAPTAAAAVEFPGAGAAYDPDLLVQATVPVLANVGWSHMPLL